MKKFALLLAVALPMVFTSCGNDDEPESLIISSTTLEISTGGRHDLNTNVPESTTWVSSDEFVATYKDGEVLAHHVGTCDMVATWNGETQTCKVTVTPELNTYVLPVMNWGADAAAVKAAVKGFQLDEANSTDNDLRFYTNATTFEFPAYQYLFNGQGYTGLFSSTLLVADDIDEALKLTEWLQQYYIETEEEEGNVYTDDEGNEVCLFAPIVDGEGASIAYGAIWTAPATKANYIDVIKAAKAAAVDMVK